jgi:hypothetical protein
MWIQKKPEKSQKKLEKSFFAETKSFDKYRESFLQVSSRDRANFIPQ